MSFQALYSELVATINHQSNRMEDFSQLNYDWLEKVVSELGLREVRVMRKSLSPVPQIIASAEIMDTPLKPLSDDEFVASDPDSELSSIVPDDSSEQFRTNFLDELSGDSDSDQFETVAKTRKISSAFDSLEGFKPHMQPMTAPVPAPICPPIEIPKETAAAKKEMNFADGTNLLDDEDSDEPVHTIRFVDSGDLRMSLDPSSLAFLREEAQGDGVSNMLSQVSSSAAQFREKWKESVHEKNLESMAGLPSEEVKSYQMSDHDDDEDDDLEMFETDPAQVHGKVVPSWARAENLEKQLRKQKQIDPDTIFPDFSLTCTLSDVFNVNNPRWTTRNESQMWDYDACTPEELQQFKQLLGLL